MVKIKNLFEKDAYLKSHETQVIAHHHDWHAVQLAETIFYPEGGGQPGDHGLLSSLNGTSRVVNCLYDVGKGENNAWLVIDDNDALPQIGETITAQIDWQRRYGFMKMHTSLHLLCALIPCHVNGCQVGQVKSRIDFHLGDYQLDKEKLQSDMNSLIKADHPTQSLYYKDEYLNNHPELVRTMSVAPPSGKGEVRFLRIGADGDENLIDLQPCGGTHIQRLGEIGEIRLGKIESKGKGNKRIYVHL